MADPGIDILAAAARAVTAQADTLRDLDVTVTKGFEAVVAGFPQVRGMPVSDQLARSGMAFNRAGGSTFGALFATARP